MTIRPADVFDDPAAIASCSTHDVARQNGRLRWSHEYALTRRVRLTTSTIWFALGQVLFLGVDALLTPDVLASAALIRLGLVASLSLLVAQALSRGSAPELLATVPIVVAVLGNVFLVLASSSSEAVHAHHLVILPILYLSIVQRPNTTIATAVASGSLAALWACLLLVGAPTTVSIAGAFEATLLIAFALTAGHHVERELKRAFVLRLRNEKAIDHLASTNDRLLELTQIDTLTGLANRRHLDQRLETAAGWSRVSGEPIALLMIDVDHFKRFNDRHGHPEGDRCLARIAGLAREQIRRQDDMLGRFGGEEFLAILMGTDLGGAEKVAERIRAAIDAEAIPHGGEGAGATVGVSIGVAAGRIDENNLVGDLLRRADDALYEAKGRGRNLVVPLDDQTAKSAERRGATKRAHDRAA